MSDEIDDLIEYEIARLADTVTEGMPKEGVDIVRAAMHRVAIVASRTPPAGPDSKSYEGPLGIIEPLPEYEISYSPRHLSGIIDAVMRSAYRLGRGDDARPTAAEVA